MPRINVRRGPAADICRGGEGKYIVSVVSVVHLDSCIQRLIFMHHENFQPRMPQVKVSHPLGIAVASVLFPMLAQ